MKTTIPNPLRSAAACACGAVLLLGSCAGPPEATEDLPPPAPRLTTEPWSDAFEEPAVLLARRIEIRGPDRVAERFVAVQDPERIRIEVETTPEGLRQVFTVLEPGAIARGQLDGWELNAEQQLVVLRQPGQVDVQVRAVGNAFFQRVGGEEQRGPELNFTGEVPWPDRR